MRWHSLQDKWEQSDKRKAKWHKWFAWHPVRIDGDAVWLEYVERKHTIIYAPLVYVVRKEYRHIQ